MPSQSPLKLLSPTRQLLLIALKRRQRATADVLASECYLSVGAVRQHLMALALQGLLRYDEERHGPGRPRHVFVLTRQGESLFPQRTNELADAILTALRDEEPEIRDRFLARLGQVQHEQMVTRLEGKEGRERLQEFVAVADQSGYFPAFEPNEHGGRIDVLHCPIYELARLHPELCEAELACMKSSLTGFKVERVTHRMAGDEYCSFLVTDAASQESQPAAERAAGFDAPGEESPLAGESAAG